MNMIVLLQSKMSKVEGHVKETIEVKDQPRVYGMVYENSVSTSLVAKLYITLVKDHEATSNVKSRELRKEIKNIYIIHNNTKDLILSKYGITTREHDWRIEFRLIKMTLITE